MDWLSDKEIVDGVVFFPTIGNETAEKKAGKPGIVPAPKANTVQKKNKPSALVLLTQVLGEEPKNKNVLTVC